MVPPRQERVGLPQEQALYAFLGQRVREARRTARLTQERLAERVGLSRTSLTNIEKGRQKILLHTLFAFAAALDVPVSQLLPEPRGMEPNHLERSLPPDLSPTEKKWIAGVMRPGKRRP